MWRNLLIAAAVLGTTVSTEAQAPPVGKQGPYTGPVCGTASDAYDVANYANTHDGNADTEWTIKRSQKLCWFIEGSRPATVKGIGPMYYDRRVDRMVIIIEFDITNPDGSHQTLMGFLPLRTALI